MKEKNFREVKTKSGVTEMAILEKLRVFLVLDHEKAESRTPDAFVFLGQTYIFNVAVIFSC